MTVQEIVGRYAILGNNQDAQGTEYTGILTLTLDAHQKLLRGIYLVITILNILNNYRK